MAFKMGIAIMAMNMNTKHNLLHVVGTLGMGGAEMLLLHYSKALGNEHYKHFVYCFGVDGPVRFLLEDIGVSVAFGPRVESIKKPHKFIKSLISLSKNLLQFIKENNIQTIHSHSNQSDKVAVVIGKIAGVPAFPTIHNTMFLIDLRKNTDLRVYLIKAVDLIIYRVAERVIAISEEVKKIICNRYKLNESQVIVVKNGIYYEQLSSKEKVKTCEGGGHKDEVKILSVGRLTHQKYFEVLIRAADCLIKNGCKNIQIQIVGTGEEQAKLSSLIKELGLAVSVDLLGVRNDVPKLMQESDILAMPSRFEGLSIAMIEAFACGLPIIASDVPGLRDYIVHKENGMLFPVGDYKAMAECILDVAGNRDMQVRLSQGAHKTFLKNFDIQTNVKPLVQLLEKYTTNMKLVL